MNSMQYKATIVTEIRTEKNNKLEKICNKESISGKRSNLRLPFQSKNSRRQHTFCSIFWKWRTGDAGYHLPKAQIKDYKFEINDKNFYDQPINDEAKTYENICKISTDQGDDYTVGFLLDYPYLKKTARWL